jgi:type I restriction enzyme S subunit
MSADISWQRLTLKSAGVKLIDCDHQTPAAVDEGYPYIAIPQLKNGHVTLDGVRRISQSDYDDWTKKLAPKANDVIVVRRCNSGESAHIPEGLKCAIGQNLVVLRADGSKVLPQYLRWLVRGTEWWDEVGKYINVGAVFDSLRCRDIPNFELPIPPIDEQRQVAATLAALDDRITLLRETNATLEAIAQALFKSWFVDFDPVRAKLEGLAPEGMDETTARLFPDSFEESELGLVPRGWQVGRVADLGDVICGKTPPTAQPENYGDDVPFITIPDMHNLLAVTATNRSLSRIGADTQKKKYLPPGSICISCIATPGLVVRVTVEAQTNQQINSVVPLERWGTAFPLFLLRRIGDAVRAGGSGGSVFHNLSKSGFEDLRVLLTNSDLAKRFDEVIEPLVSKIVSNQKQAQTLATLRDTLLPRLISGQLRLPEAQAAAEEALA